MRTITHDTVLQKIIFIKLYLKEMSMEQNF